MLFTLLHPPPHFFSVVAETRFGNNGSIFSLFMVHCTDENKTLGLWLMKYKPSLDTTVSTMYCNSFLSLRTRMCMWLSETYIGAT